jgi:hypothetical protein
MTDELKLLSFTESAQVVDKSGSVESNCNSIEFINQGTDTFTILATRVLQGFSMVRPGNVGEINKTNYNITFENAAGKTQQVIVIRKIYS